MAYTSNVPQANQQIAATQGPILANFTFLSTGIGTEHNFDATGSGSDMFHLQASMPNLAGGDPTMLPANTNGLYYVLGGVPKFYNTAANFIQLTKVPQQILTGTVALSTSATNVATIPANSVGQYWIFYKNINAFVSTACASGFVLTDNNSIFIARAESFDPGINLSSNAPGATGRNLLAAVNSSGNAGTYNYLITYYNP
jgi:hypothetical protein